MMMMMMTMTMTMTMAHRHHRQMYGRVPTKCDSPEVQQEPSLSLQPGIQVFHSFLWFWIPNSVLYSRSQDVHGAMLMICG